MSKGEQTRKAILEVALDQASQLGLEGLTIGKLADRLDMSKSGVFAHFRSREDLQLAVLELAGQRFVAQVLQPALAQPRGLARLRSMVSNWFELHSQSCIFIAAAIEYDDRPGVIRQAVSEAQQRWRQEVARCVRHAIERGQLKPDTDEEQVAFEIFSVVLGVHHDARLFGHQDQVRRRAHAALERILEPIKLNL